MQLADALVTLHAVGKLHRDIKPSNVLVTTEGRLVVLDFGLVAQANDSEDRAVSSVQGTPAYMSPEQLANEALSPASDWYSVGVMMYQALTGEVPHVAQATHWLDLARLRQSSDLPSPRSINGDVPDDLNDLCLRLLRADAITRPSGDEVVSTLRRTRTEVSISPPASTGFVGRAAELLQLSAAFSATLVGGPVLACIYGVSGIGKSALLQHFLTGVQSGHGATVLRGRCYEQESVPYKALDHLIDELCVYWQGLPRADAEALVPQDIEALARLFPVIYNVEAVAERAHRQRGALDGREMRRQAILAFRDLLLRIADKRPLVLCIDDLQWGDVDSAHLLGEVLRLPAPPPHLLLLSCRAEDRQESAFLRALFATPVFVTPMLSAVREIVMEPLSPAEARELAAALLPRGEGQLAGAIAQEAAGSPLIVGELVHYVAGPGRLGPERALDLGLEHVLQGRLSELPLDARRVLEAVALAGGPIREAVACQAGAPGGNGQSILAVLRNRKLIRSCAAGRDSVEIYHDRIREAVVRGIAPDHGRDQHLRLAEALRGSADTDPEVLAFHFRAGAQPEAASSYAIQAAENAVQALAFDRAARLCQLSLALLSPEDPRAQGLELKLADALTNVGRSPESAAVYLRAAARADAAEARQLRQRAAEQLLLSGHVDEGLVIIDAVLKDLGLRFPRGRKAVLLSLVWLRVRLRLRGIRFRRRDPSPSVQAIQLRVDTCWAVGLYLSSVDPARGAYFQAYALLLALRAGDPQRVARSLSVEVAYRATAGKRSLDRALPLLWSSRAIAEQLNQPYLFGILTLVDAIVAFMAEERWAKCSDLCLRAEGIFRKDCRAVSWELSNGKFFFLNSLLLRGELSTLAACLPEALKNAQDHGDLFSESFLRFRFLSTIELAKNSPPERWTEFETLATRLSTREFYLQHYWERHAVAQRLLYAGEGAEALVLLRSLWPPLRRSLLMQMQFHRVDAWHLRARCVLAAAEVSTLRRARVDLLRAACSDAGALEKEKTARAKALAWLVRASVARLQARVEEAHAYLESAADAFDAIAMALYAAAARLQRGRLLGGSRGAELVMDARSWMQGQGIEDPDRMSNMLIPGLTRL